MKKFILFGLVLFATLASAQSDKTIEQFREAYRHARQDAEICKQQIAIIDRMTLTSNLELAYAGAFYAVWPEHLSSPLKKLNAFKKGKNDLEKALSADPGNAEIHFLRLTIQHYAPAMLGYDNEKQQDLKIVLDNYDKTKSPKLKANIKEFLLSTDLLTTEQKQILQ